MFSQLTAVLRDMKKASGKMPEALVF